MFLIVIRFAGWVLICWFSIQSLSKLTGPRLSARNIFELYLSMYISTLHGVISCYS